MIKNRGQLQTVPGIAAAVTVDGWGGRAAKLSKYHLFARTRPDRFNGLKLFYTQDTNLMKPARGDASASLARRHRLPVAQPGTAPSPAKASRASSSVVAGMRQHVVRGHQLGIADPLAAVETNSIKASKLDRNAASSPGGSRRGDRVVELVQAADLTVVEPELTVFEDPDDHCSVPSLAGSAAGSAAPSPASKLGGGRRCPDPARPSSWRAPRRPGCRR